MEQWKTIEPTVWKPAKEGDNITGVLVNKEPKDENTSLSARYYLETDNGTCFLWGSAVLDDRMQYVKKGSKVKITYEGATTNKRNQKVNLYKVQVAKENSLKNEDEDVKPMKLEELDSLE
jgi:hypothetical protein